MNTLRYNECRRQCRYNYTDAERLAKGRDHADEKIALNALIVDFDQVKKDYKARIEAREAKIDQLANAVSSGYEMREYLCFWTYDDPKPGRKTLRRHDTNEVIEEADMDGADTQTVMQLIDAEAAAATELKKAIEAVNDATANPDLKNPDKQIASAAKAQLETAVANRDKLKEKAAKAAANILPKKARGKKNKSSPTQAGDGKQPAKAKK